MAEEGQEHPISTYLWVWLLLFVLSAFSYAVDYIGFQGFTRWSLVLLFMFLKAYFICAVFMHMVWERMALVLGLFIPTFAIVGLLLLFIKMSPMPQTAKLRAIIIIKNFDPIFLSAVVIFFIIFTYLPEYFK